jgi:isochorismate pyruvate lyase
MNGSEGAPTEIAELRGRIDALDREIVRLMADRCRLATAAGERKRSRGLALVDPPREAAVVRRAAAHAREAGIDEEVVRRVFWWLIELGRRSQGIRPGDVLP